VFRAMQDCFRQHPEMYGSELEDDEDDVEQELYAREGASGDAASQQPSELSHKTSKVSPLAAEESRPAEARGDSKSTIAVSSQPGDTGGELLPKATDDASSK